MLGKSATICLLAALIVGKMIESNVTVGELPKFWPLIVTVLWL